MALSGAWSRRNQVAPVIPAQAATDPDHLNAPDRPDTPPMWVQNTPMPSLPGELLTTNEFPAPLFAPGGPVDRTPRDHNFGPGVQPGITQAQASELRGYWQSLDMGTVAAETWVPGEDLDNQYNLAEIPDGLNLGDSPATLLLKQQGAGTPLDPDARLGHRQKRWSQRYIDMHRYEVHPSPYEPQYSVPQDARTAVQGGTQVVPPFGNRVQEYLGPIDGFVQQQIRRAPERYGDAYADDGTAQNMSGSVTGYGLNGPADNGMTQWGL